MVVPAESEHIEKENAVQRGQHVASHATSNEAATIHTQIERQTERERESELECGRNQ